MLLCRLFVRRLEYGWRILGLLQAIHESITGAGHGGGGNFYVKIDIEVSGGLLSSPQT